MFEHLADHVEEQVAVSGRVQLAVRAPLGGDGCDNEGEVSCTQTRRIGAASDHQCLRSSPAGAQRLADALEVGAGGPGPVLGHLAQPDQLDDPEVDGALSSGPAPRAVGLEVQQRHLPDVTEVGIGPLYATHARSR